MDPTSACPEGTPYPLACLPRGSLLSGGWLGPQRLPLRVIGGQARPSACSHQKLVLALALPMWVTASQPQHLACPHNAPVSTPEAQGLSAAPGLVPPSAEQRPHAKRVQGVTLPSCLPCPATLLGPGDSVIQSPACPPNPILYPGIESFGPHLMPIP